MSSRWICNNPFRPEVWHGGATIEILREGLGITSWVMIFLSMSMGGHLLREHMNKFKMIMLFHFDRVGHHDKRCKPCPHDYGLNDVETGWIQGRLHDHGPTLWWKPLLLLAETPLWSRNSRSTRCAHHSWRRVSHSSGVMCFTSSMIYACPNINCVNKTSLMQYYLYWINQSVVNSIDTPVVLNFRRILLCSTCA